MTTTEQHGGAVPEAMPPILCIGDLVVDIVLGIESFPILAGQHQPALGGSVEPGGSGNFLIAGARLGWPMQVVGSLGEDEWGPLIVDMLREEGIETGGIRLEGETTVVLALVSQAGEHVFLGVQAHNEPIAASADDRELARKAGAIFCFGYTLGEPHLTALAFDLISTGRESGVPVFFDPGPLIARVPEASRRRIISLSDGIFLTEEELPFLASSPEELLALGAGFVVLKLGPRGCRLITPEGHLDVPGYPVTAVDTSAAGDSFAAAFLVGRLRGLTLAEAARLANAMGAAKVQKMGSGRKVPTLEEVRVILQQFEVPLEI
jgi:sugar/nucleoside kinase (ribokinase family)